MLVLRGGSSTKDGGDGLGGILVGRACILLPSYALAVVYFVVVAPWPLCILCAKIPVQALALRHGVLGAFVDRAWTI